MPHPLEGRYNMFTGDSEILDVVLVPEEDFLPDDGWSGGLELGARPAGSPWDFVGRFTYGYADINIENPDFVAAVEESHAVADFEIGRHVGIGLLGGGDTRVHAGVRFGHFHSVLDSDSAEVDGLQNVMVIGPRIGIDQTVPIGNRLSAELSAAGAVLFGHRDREFQILGGEEFVTVWNAEASAGLSYHFGRGAATLGYRIDAFWDLYGDVSASGQLFTEGGDRITHGPFAKVTFDLSGDASAPGGGGVDLSGYAFDNSGAAPYIWASLEGRYDMFTNSQIFGPEFDPGDGWSVGLELGARPAGSPWDYVGRVIYGRASQDSVISDESFSVELDRIIADFEAGRYVGNGLFGGDTRVHAGARFVHFDADLDAIPTESLKVHERVTAGGPRIGIDQTVPLGGGLTIDLSAAGAVLFGTRDFDSPLHLASEDATVWNAEASGGLTYRFGRGAATLGYRVDAFWNVYGDFQISELPDLGGSNHITHGPFAKLTFDLSGSGD